MPVAVECYFAEDYSERVRQLWNVVGSQLPALGYRPHFSLAVFDDSVDVDALRHVVDPFSSQLNEFAVQVTSLGAFCTDPAVLVLTLSLDKDLFDLHTRLNERLAVHHLCPIPYYLPDNWTPHITLDQWLDYEALGRRVAKAAPLCQALIGPAKVVEIGMIRCNPVEELWTRRLSARRV